MIKVFISHSSKDKIIIEKLVTNIDSLKNTRVFCSSYESTNKLENGKDIYETIKEEILSSDIVLFVLSENFYKSEPSLLELGIAYAQSDDIIIRPTVFRHDEYKKYLKLIFNENIKTIILDNEDSIGDLLHEISYLDKVKRNRTETRKLSDKIDKMSLEIKESIEMLYKSSSIPNIPTEIKKRYVKIVN